MSMQTRRLTRIRDALGESPCWDAATPALCWIDALAGTLHRLVLSGDTAADEPQAHVLPGPVGAIAPCAGAAAVVVALRSGFARYQFDTRTLQPLAAAPFDDPRLRLNDGKCDAAGNFLAGTIHAKRGPGEAPQGGLYRLRPDRTVEHLAGDIGFANGPCFSPDGRTLYLADSLERTIWAWDYDPHGPLRRRREFVRTHEHDSGPDGATVDAQGHLWTALPRAGRLARYTPEGRLERVVALPVTHPTSLCFGGAALDRAYVTSISRSPRLHGPLPQDGGLFELTGLPAPGLPTQAYGG